MTKKQKADRLRQIAADTGKTPFDVAVANPGLAGGLEILAKEAADASSTAGSKPATKPAAARPSRGSGPALMSSPSAEDALLRPRR